jgi:hypothetical protein
MCFLAHNTNTEPRCVLSFTYRKTGKGSLPGGNLAPGEKRQICSLQPGVDVEFGKWTLSGASSR